MHPIWLRLLRKTGGIVSVRLKKQRTQNALAKSLGIKLREFVTAVCSSRKERRMKANSRPTIKAKQRTFAQNLALLFVKLGVLVVDDVFEPTEEQLERFVIAYGEYIDGYGEMGEKAAKEIDEELKLRDIFIKFVND